MCFYLFVTGCPGRRKRVTPRLDLDFSRHVEKDRQTASLALHPSFATSHNTTDVLIASLRKEHCLGSGSQVGEYCIQIGDERPSMVIFPPSDYMEQIKQNLLPVLHHLESVEVVITGVAETGLPILEGIRNRSIPREMHIEYGFRITKTDSEPEMSICYAQSLLG